MKMKQLLAAAAAFALGVMPLEAQRGADSKDAAEIKAYRLTMDGLRKMAAAGENLARAISADPRFKAGQALNQQIEALEQKDELTEAESKKLEDLRAKLEELESKKDQDGDASSQTLDDMVRRIEREPVMAKAIRDAGLSPREYTLVGLVTFQAMMVHGIQKQFGNKQLPPDLAATVLADNIKFVSNNEAEITRLLEKMKSLEKKP